MQKEKKFKSKSFYAQEDNNGSNEFSNADGTYEFMLMALEERLRGI